MLGKNRNPNSIRVLQSWLLEVWREKEEWKIKRQFYW